MSLKLNSRERPKSTACLGEEDNHIKLGELLMLEILTQKQIHIVIQDVPH